MFFNKCLSRSSIALGGQCCLRSSRNRLANVGSQSVRGGLSINSSGTWRTVSSLIPVCGGSILNLSVYGGSNGNPSVVGGSNGNPSYNNRFSLSIQVNGCQFSAIASDGCKNTERDAAAEGGECSDSSASDGEGVESRKRVKNGGEDSLADGEETEYLDENKLEVCQQKMEAANERSKILQDKLLRALADHQNTRSRHDREMSGTREYAITNFAKAMLDVADSMAYATKSMEVFISRANLDKNEDLVKKKEFQQLFEGLKITEQLLHKSLGNFDVIQYDPLHEIFNPKVHEAVFEMTDPSKEPGVIAQVLQKGYKIKDRVLRAAKVGVVKED